MAIPRFDVMGGFPTGGNPSTVTPMPLPQGSSPLDELVKTLGLLEAAKEKKRLANWDRQIRQENLQSQIAQRQSSQLKADADRQKILQEMTKNQEAIAFAKSLEGLPEPEVVKAIYKHDSTKVMPMIKEFNAEMERREKANDFLGAQEYQKTHPLVLGEVVKPRVFKGWKVEKLSTGDVLWFNRENGDVYREAPDRTKQASGQIWSLPGGIKKAGPETQGSVLSGPPVGSVKIGSTATKAPNAPVETPDQPVDEKAYPSELQAYVDAFAQNGTPIPQEIQNQISAFDNAQFVPETPSAQGQAIPLTPAPKPKYASVIDKNNVVQEKIPGKIIEMPPKGESNKEYQFKKTAPNGNAIVYNRNTGEEEIQYGNVAKYVADTFGYVDKMKPRFNSLKTVAANIVNQYPSLRTRYQKALDTGDLQAFTSTDRTNLGTFVAKITDPQTGVREGELAKWGLYSEFFSDLSQIKKYFSSGGSSLIKDEALPGLIAIADDLAALYQDDEWVRARMVMNFIHSNEMKTDPRLRVDEKEIADNLEIPQLRKIGSEVAGLKAKITGKAPVQATSTPSTASAPVAVPAGTYRRKVR